MTKPLLLAGGLLCLAALLIPLSDFRDSARQKERQAAQRWREFNILQGKTGTAPKASTVTAPEAAPLFAVVNRCATETGVTERMEQLRPRGEGSSDRRERVDVRLNGLYLEQALRFLQALERETGLHIESCVLSRTGQERLDLSLLVAREAEPR